MSEEIENFYGVYLLYNVNPKFKGRTYIGFTVNPNRRIQQHNKGKHAGGAWRTSGKGPWEMVLIIHGFPNDISALRFEWAWQKPKLSRRLRHLPGKSKKENQFLYCFRIMSNMLRTGPWNRMPLTIRWLKQNYQVDFPPDTQPPIHMAVTYGPVRIKKICKKKDVEIPDSQTNVNDEDLLTLTQPGTQFPRCSCCRKNIKAGESTLKCVYPKCQMISHMVCLSKKFLSSEKEQLVPLDGQCPKCKQKVLWGELIRLKKGCYQNLEEYDSDKEDQEDSDHWANELQVS